MDQSESTYNINDIAHFQSVRKSHLNKHTPETEYECNNTEGDIDYIFNEIVGGGSRSDWGQWIILLALIPVGLCGEFPLFMHLFACYESPHRCYVHNCDTDATSNLIKTDWLSFATPENHTYNEMLITNAKFDPCNRYSSIGNDCTPSSFNTSGVEKCERFVYDQSVVLESFTTRFNLVCDGEWKLTLLNAMIMAGLMTGSTIGGRLGDRYGRKLVMVYAVIVIVPTVVLAANAPDFWTYSILKFVCTVSSPCIWFANHSLLTEIFGAEYRRRSVVISGLISPFIRMCLVAVYYITQHWISFHIWTGVFCGLALPALLIIPE